MCHSQTLGDGSFLCDLLNSFMMFGCKSERDNKVKEEGNETVTNCHQLKIIHRDCP